MTGGSRIMLDQQLLDAINKTPYYQKFYSTIHLEDLRNMSIIKKQDVINNIEDFLSNGSFDADLIRVSTSGSTGNPLQITWNSLDYCSSLMEIWRYRKKFGLTPLDNFVTAHISYASNNNVFINKMIIQKNNLSLSKVYFDEDTLLGYYNMVSEFQPKWMLLPPSFLYGMLNFLHKRQLRLPSSIILIELTGEYCPKEIFEYFEMEYANIEWRLLYGMQEFNVIGYGSPNGLEILQNNVLVEIARDDGSRAEQGEEGAIIVTGLKNKVMPLVRYETGDVGYIDSNRKLVISRARSNDSITTESGIYDGSLFWLVILKLKLELALDILQFQVILNDNTLYFYLQLGEDTEPDKIQIIKYIRRILLKFYDLSYDVIVKYVHKIQPFTKNNKIKFFINNQNVIAEKGVIL